MLRFQGSQQPPRKYEPPVPENYVPPEKDECNVCVTRVWTAKLYTKLQEASAGLERVSHTYKVTSHELRTAVQAGCKFCRSLADGVNGKVFLDELYARIENQMSSEGKSDDENNNEDTKGGSEEHEETMDEWNDASAFNEDEMDNDVTGGWDSWEDRDTLVENVEFLVHLSFERGDGKLFSILNVFIEAHDREEGENIVQILGTLNGDGKVELRYHLNEAVSDSSHVKNFPATTASTVLGSNSNMELITEWASTIQSQEMNLEEYERLLPARLIYLKEDRSLQIVATTKIPLGERVFAALSYVWGVNQTFTLTHNTKVSLESGFKLDRLPQTIQDAIMVTRAAGLRYLWVDALCIIQDSSEDKSRELPKMRSIYKHCAFTIVASVATSATHGFLNHVTTEDYFIDPIYISNPTSPSHPRTILSYPSSYHRHRDPINSRAWTFQELILSTRAVLFSYRGVTLLDRSAPSTRQSHVDAQLPSLPWSGSVFSLSQRQENIRVTWLVARGEYTRRNLTWSGDKLLAIAGVAEEIGRTYKSRYIAGLWERDLLADLQWRCYPTDNLVKQRRSDVYVAPSWSWASVVGPVEAAEPLDELDESDSEVDKKIELDFEIVDCKVKLVDETFEFGAVSGGELVVKGLVYTLVWRPHEEWSLQSQETDGFLYIVGTETAKEVQVGGGAIDAVDDEVMDGAEVACLAMSMSDDAVEGLMLLPVDGKKWRRVGFFTLHVSFLYDGCEPEEVTII